MENFDNFRIEQNMDQHFYKATVLQNLPVTGLISIWNRTFLNFPTQLVVSYSSALDNLVPYLQQLEMESFGKSPIKRVLGYPTQHLALFGVVQDLTPSMPTSNYYTRVQISFLQPLSKLSKMDLRQTICPFHLIPRKYSGTGGCSQWVLL